jgi:hypothetical protein
MCAHIEKQAMKQQYGVCAVCQLKAMVKLVAATPEEKAITGETSIIVIDDHRFGNMEHCAGSGIVPQTVINHHSLG